MSASASQAIVVRYRDQAVQFQPCGGSVEQTLRAGRFYEAQFLQYVEALALPGVYVDVGGYIGTHAIFFAGFCPASQVHTFEPRPRMHDHLQANLQANRLTERVRLHQLGLSDRDEVVKVRLEGKDETFTCRRLDDVIDVPVSVMKIDVEGMEEKVLAGASRILGESKPLVFIEAHTDDELRRDAALLAPYGYRPTGRVFNASPTYEFAADDSPTAPTSRLPQARSLHDPARWASDDKALQVSFTADGLRAVARLGAEQAAHLTQPPAKLKSPPADARLAVSRGVCFLEMTGACYGATLFVMEYAGGARVETTRYFVTHQFFQRLELKPGTERIRLAVRLSGEAELGVSRVALHLLDRD
jgi:FkbM family methyltransferase